MAQTAEQRKAKRTARYDARVAAFRCVHCNAGLPEERAGVFLDCVECEELMLKARAKYEAAHPGRTRGAPHRYVRSESVNKARRETYASKVRAKKCAQRECKAAAYSTSPFCKRHRELGRKASRDYWRRKHWPQIAARNLARVARAVAAEPTQLRRAA